MLQTGYNRIYLEVHRSGELIDDIYIELTPVMHIEQYSHSSPDIEGIIDIDVEDSNRVITFMTEDEDRYVLTLIEPVQPETGLNDLIVALH